MGLLDLLIEVSMPVLQMLLITALGLVLALDRLALLREDARKHLNNIEFFILNPALISSNLSKTITLESMRRLWFMPLNNFITFIVGSILVWVVNQITRAPKHLRGLVIGCCAAGNMCILLIIIPAVCKEKGSPFGAPDVCHTYGMGYASLSMAVSLWTKLRQYMGVLSRKMNLKKLFAPSTSGAIAGFVVGLVPQIKKSVIGDAAPLHVVQDTASLLGDGAVPLLKLIMGGNLLKGLRGSGVEKSILVGVIVVKYIAMPLIGIGVVKGASWLGLVHDDPLYQFVLLLQFAVPPAMNIATMTQLFGAGERVFSDYVMNLCIDFSITYNMEHSSCGLYPDHCFLISLDEKY